MTEGSICFCINKKVLSVMSGAGFEPGHRSRRISSLYDENALAQTSTESCGFGEKKS